MQIVGCEVKCGKVKRKEKKEKRVAGRLGGGNRPGQGNRRERDTEEVIMELCDQR